MPRNPNAEPKPFVLIEIPSRAPERKPATTHEKFAGLTGRLELTFTVVSEYLFVGSGAYGFDPNARGDRPDVWYTFYRCNGQICVPGTSIKGAIRAIVETISNSCVSQRHPRERISSPHHQPCRFQNEKSPLCPACRLFGAIGRTGYRGRVHFSDFLPNGEVRSQIVKIGELWEPKRYDSTKRRFYESKSFQPTGDSRPQSGFRFVEAVRKETKFQGILMFENLGEAELGLLFHALGWAVEGERVIIAFAPKIGGAKPRCFGSVQFNPVRLRLWGGNWGGLLTPQIATGKEVLPFLSRCLQECRGSRLLHSESWEALRHGFQPRSEPCPREVY
jgi:CRISPR/Cas system CSM-associated protein Csm3 (group 7 of RAMP superfamily)